MVQAIANGSQWDSLPTDRSWERGKYILHVGRIRQIMIMLKHACKLIGTSPHQKMDSNFPPFVYDLVLMTSF